MTRAPGEVRVRLEAKLTRIPDGTEHQLPGFTQQPTSAASLAG